MNDSNPTPAAGNTDHADTLTDLNLRAFADAMKMPGAPTHAPPALVRLR